MSQRTFWTQIVQQLFCLLEGFFRLFALMMQQPTPRPRHFLFGEHKLHRIPAARPSDDPTADSAKYQLFNLASDAQETNDLADSEPLRVQSMKAALRAWQQSVINSLNGNDYAK